MATRQVECSLLAGMMTFRPVCDRALEHLKDDDFQFRNHRYLFTAIAQTVARSTNGAVPDDLLLQRTLGELSHDDPEADPIATISTVRELAFEMDPSYADAYINEVRESSERRQTAIVGRKVEELVDQGADLATIRGFVNASFDNLEKGFGIASWDDPIELFEVPHLDLPPVTSLLGQKSLVPGRLHLFTGAPGLGKSWLAVQLQCAISLGIPFLNLETTRIGCGLIAAELPPQEYQIRARATLEHARFYHPRAGLLDGPQGIAPFLSHEQTHGAVNLSNAQDIRMVKDFIERHQLGLLIIDPISRMHRFDENKAEEIATFLGTLETLAVETGCGILMVHHEPKDGKEREDIYAARGSSRFASDPNSIFRLKKDPHTDRLVFVSAKQNYGSPFEPIWLDYEPGGVFVPTDPPRSQTGVEGLQEMCIEYLLAMAPAAVTVDQIMDATNNVATKTTYTRALKKIPNIQKVGNQWKLTMPSSPTAPNLPRG